MVRASKEFVRIYVDGTKASAEVKARMKAMGITGYPTIALVDPSGRIAHRLEGNRPAADYTGPMNEMIAALPERRLAAALPELGELRAWIEKRIEKLADADLDTRDRATGELRALKQALETALEAAGRSNDPEQAGRALRLLRKPKPEPIVVPVKP